MSVALSDLSRYLDQCLRIDQFQDYCPNGLQVEGRSQVKRLASGVTACQRLIDEAIAWGADALLVHHGYFWRGETQQIVGMKRRRLAALLRNDVSLLAYHLPLDAHPQFGNNACLGRLMGVDPEFQEPLHPGSSTGVGNIATLPQPASVAQLLEKLTRVTDRKPLLVGDPDTVVRRIAWCTGAAQGYIDAAINAGADVYVTGEASEQTVHTAREEGIQFIAAGHHATERYGVQAVGEHVAEKFGLQHLFIDVENPV